MHKTVHVVGIGPGSRDCLTLRAQDAIRCAGLLIGAERMLDLFADIPAEKCACISPGEIADSILQSGQERVAVLMSGDVGFFSGAKKLISLLDGYEVECIPGISSLQYLCARLRIPWEDIYVVSAHGRPVNIAAQAAARPRTFFLTGGETDAQSLCRALADCGMGDARVTIGSGLSYPDEEILVTTAAQAAEQSFDALSVVLVERRSVPRWGYATGGIPDELFLRGDAPMTKAEARCVSLSKLGLRDGDTVYDVGAGTGSVSVEAALAIPGGRVFAIERDQAAVDLIKTNRRAFGARNIELVEGEAPEALSALPAPDAVFIGGSGGNLSDILRAVLLKNPRVRVVINAVTLETLEKSMALMQTMGFEETDVIQLSVSRAKRAGASHMLLAQNPVFIISGRGKDV